ncbi:uncharacterized protein SPAPADRAFT_56614 [Spathaspora passalidarum NRRL Y-27907]|uniref:Uncharacterized protein n=1 Tax=Spathaspora passalidarum (strain NRRL Y-27907 / 11-Y1) TaxID=619300 RepID=G3AS18_SPAPN|nr:uncharacterized protein SPAPADRAFT_56614 [Spathaspora passalidarum NRRL Y-27907]EGW31867.1 hypothetical protein SPAPADRAFT_56614 [Spathaspora passalidarum NRRL Y-27907]
MVGNHDSTGVIVNTNELPDLLNLEKVDYQVYLSALIRLIDTMVEYTNGTVIRGSIQSKGPYGKDYSIAMINLEIVLKLEKGFQLLDLNNENLRKLYDSLKLNCQKLSKMTYDLSLRNLINVKGETV